VLTISPGHSVEYLTREVASGRENYYTGAVTEGEPPGRWYGAGAESLGLTGLVDHQDMHALYERFLDPRDARFRDPRQWDEVPTLGHAGRKYPTADEIYQRSLDAEPYADFERREQLRLNAAKAERRNIAFMDITYSVQKSVTVLHAGFEAQEVKARRAGDAEAATAWAAYRQAVEDAIWAGNNAALDYLQEQAGYSRVGHHGGAAGRFIDAHEWTVASFFQHTSRTNDPQLHIHNALAWRSQGVDGTWRTLDSRSLYLHRPAAGAIADRTTVEHLARGLRVSAAMRPDGKSRELIGVPEQVNDLFSSRVRTMGPKVAELARLFEQRYGREPNALERDRLQQQAAMITRPRKSHDGETLEQRLDRWERQLQAEVSVSLEQVAADVVALAEHEAPQARRFDPDAVLETAIADVQASKAAWTKPDLMRAIDNALPDHLGGLDGAIVQQLLSALANKAIERHAVSLTAEVAGDASLPDELRLADGSSAYERPGGHLYATDAHLRSERALRAATRDHSASRLTHEQAAAFLNGLAETGLELGADQSAAVRGVLTSGATVESLVGPAGTGKSFVVGVINHAWTDPAHWPDSRPRRVIGLAASQIATTVVAEEGLIARNITRWLASQQRLAEGRPHPDDVSWQLSSGDLVVVDESAMADTAALAQIHAHAERAGAKLLLTGDHRQLAAVGAAGGMQLAAESGRTYELTEARRFTHSWERAASLHLREGDDAALQAYGKHGRIIDAGTIEQAHASAARAWLADTLAGRESLLIVDTSEQADRMCAHLRAELVRFGRVEEYGVPLGRQHTIAGRGDLVQARLNGWHLAGYEGNRRGPINRETYRVLDVREDDGLIVAPILGRTTQGEQLGHPMTLPGTYVAEHVALGYASTAHSAQGRTVDTAHSVASSHTSRAALYVALTRGRHGNTAHAVTVPVADDDAPTGTANQIERRDPLAVLSRSDEDEHLLADQAALAQAEHHRADARSLRTLHERFTDGCEVATAGRTAALLDQLAGDGVLTPGQRARLAADDGVLSLDRALRQAEIAGHDPRSVLRDAAASRELDNARSLASVLHHRITDTVDLHPASDRYTDWIPAVDSAVWQRHLRELAEAADTRRDQLGHETAAEAPAWAVAAFGPVPDDQDERDAWAERATAVAAHRELSGHDDAEVALPGPPKRGQVEAYASWRAGWRALGRDEATREEAELSDGQLRVRVRAYEREKAWEPDYVAPDLAGTTQAAQRHRGTATLREAEAEHETDPQRREQLERKAAEATALADLLDRQAAQLEKADEIRALWYAHTAGSRAAADRARDELGSRGINPDTDERAVTAEQWLEAHHAEEAIEDQHRDITEEHDFTEVAEQRDQAQREAEPEPRDAVESNVADIREHAASEPKRASRGDDNDWTRVPTADQTADSITRAQRALNEIHQRDADDRRREAEQARARQLNHWHHDDRQAERAAQRGDDRQRDRV
jgi:conjugative relaxase-like TrwC/TraI family protein